METPVESATVARTAPAKPKPNKRRARVSIDKRYAIGRRYKQLAALYCERVGLDVERDPVLLAAVEKAAQLTALAEAAAARALRADPKVTLDDVVRLTRLADLAVRRLNLPSAASKPPPSLAEYLVSNRTTDEATE